MGRSEVEQGLSSLIWSLELGPAAAPPGSALLSPTWRTCASSFIIYDLQLPDLYKGS